jgi:hypothetical protein
MRELLILIILIALGVVGYLLLTGRLALGGTPLTPRSPGTDGSAHWAYAVALPRAKMELAPDAVVVEISGEGVMPDGRLAANTGKWTLHFSSFTAAARLPVFVDHLKNVTVGAKTSPGVIHALGSPPGTFPDSIAIFTSTSGKGASGTRTVVNPVVCTFDGIAGSHVWSIKFKVGSATETHRVRWDNVWLEVI